MKASENIFLSVRAGVVLTDITEPVVCALEPFFKEANVRRQVTSGLRSGVHQLEIIQSEARKRGIDKICPNILTATLTGKFVYHAPVPGNPFDGKEVYEWQPAWSQLLVRGFMVNPPIAVPTLVNYQHPKKGVVVIGTVIPISGHQLGEDFDIGKGADLQETADVVKRAFESRTIVGFKGFLVEKVNGAVHCDCKSIKK